ncbi:MAG: deoxyribonuclease IV [Spirochaetales bacterium]|nr:deoxyribonuclease IV [Spirochaetales bacterium]
MKYTGAHVSISGGLFKAPENANRLGATAFAMFTKNQRQWLTRPLTEEDISGFKNAMDEFGYRPFQVLPHDGYLINLANPDDEKRKKSLESFIDECRRCEALGLTGLNFHPGSRLEGDEESGLKLIADSLKTAISETEKVRLIIENTAGQGSALGNDFKHLERLIELVGKDERMGVCIDTCHSWAAGYDLKEGFEDVWDEFDRLIGFKFLKGMHLNDAKKPLNSRVDRHAPLGEGTMGWGVFEKIMADKRFDNIPLILETPELERWSGELQRLNEAFK